MLDQYSYTPEEQATVTLLREALSAAVPLWTYQLQRRTWDEIDGRIPFLTEMICAHGDGILYKSKKHGDTAKAFNALAETIAILSFAPGGVRFLGLHWSSAHPDTSKGMAARALKTLERLGVVVTGLDRVRRKAE